LFLSELVKVSADKFLFGSKRQIVTRITRMTLA